MPGPLSIRDAYRAAERRVVFAREKQQIDLVLEYRYLRKLPDLDNLPTLRRLSLDRSEIADLAPVANLKNLEELSLWGSDVEDLSPISGLVQLKRLNISFSKIADVSMLGNLRNLREFELWSSRVVDISVVSRMPLLQELVINGTKVSDISHLSKNRRLQHFSADNTNISRIDALAQITSLIDAVNISASKGISLHSTPLDDPKLQDFSRLPNPEKTIRIINYLREQQGLPIYHEAPLELEDEDVLVDESSQLGATALENIPSPFEFDVTARNTITVTASDSNVPVFPFSTSRDDHSNRLEACRVLTNDLVESLSSRRYDNVRAEYQSYLQRYAERLPSNTDNGNMLLADSMARALGHLFAADIETLPNGFSSELRAMLEQHVALCVYYPEIGTFNRDVRDGKPSRPFPLDAARKFVETVREFTPQAFEPDVSNALSEAQSSSPPAPAPSANILSDSSGIISPPAIPGGVTDPKKSREFATASTTNRLWKTVQTTAVISTASHGIVDAAHALAPHAKELIDWLAELVKTLG